ncbi:MAG: reverse transcriptase domain-containing protein [Gaiellaceae bacterium]
MKELYEKGQGIRMSGVSAQFQNGAAENAIKIVVQKARTMMIHAALRWPEAADKSLWPMALSHATYLYNHTPSMESGLSPAELFSRTKNQNHGELLNAHPWGCPTYVLTPKLRDGQSIPKWEPRSKQGQYMGASPMHASTVGLVRNLQTGSITPQFHMVYDDFFETVHSDHDKEPKEWKELLQFSRFKSDFDDADYVPQLADEWLSDEEVAQKRQDEEKQKLIPRTERLLQRESPKVDRPDEGSQESMAMPQAEVANETELQREQLHEATVPDPEPIGAEADAPDPAMRPKRQRRPPDRYGYGRVKAYQAMTSFCAMIAASMLGTQGFETDLRYMAALLTDMDHGTQEGNIPPWYSEYPHAMKAKKTQDPDTPTFDQAMNGPHREEFIEAMRNEVSELEEHGTWTTVYKSDVPDGVKILPSTWAFKIKRYPDGRFRKFKGRFCVRGDKQVEGVDYFEKYAPVVQWPTVRMMLCMAAHLGLATRQIDFSNAFVQAMLNEDVYIQAPRYFRAPPGDPEFVLKLNKSLYGLVQAPLYWSNHLKDALEAQGFKASTIDPCLWMNDDMVILTYVDDCLFFGKSQDKIDEMIKRFQDAGLGLTVEDDVFAFLGVEMAKDESGKTELRQIGLIEKILKTCNMEECAGKKTPCEATPLRRDTYGEACQESWDYASVVGMLMYLSSNSRPDIQFAVHQCARYTHQPRRRHEDAIKRICRYLKETKGRGLRFEPDNQMQLDCYVDADFAGLWNIEDDQDPVCVKSRTGYCLTLGNCPLIWVSKLQSEVALSTTEAEYIALSQAMRDLIPLRALLQEVGTNLGMDFAKPAIMHSTVFEDNNGALSMAVAPRITPRNKHIAVKYHHFRDHVGKEKGIEIVRIDTDKQKADCFTKGMNGQKFETIRRLLMGW